MPSPAREKYVWQTVITGPETDVTGLIIPRGIAFLGGVALFNPASDLLLPREKQVMAYGMLGEENLTIGKVLHISINTVKTYLSRAYAKTGAPSRAGLLEHSLRKREDDSQAPMIMTRYATHRDVFNQLTPRELQVARLVGLGLDNSQIGDEFGLSALTIKSNLDRITDKVGFDGRELLAAGAVLSGLTGQELTAHPSAADIAAPALTGSMAP